MVSRTVHRYIGQDQEEPIVFPFAGGQVAVFSRRAPGKESLNEDAAALIEVSEQSAVIVVADGCGGMSCGDTASRIAIQSLCQSVKDTSISDAGLRAAILDGIEHANQKVRDLRTGAATTLAAVELNGTLMRAFHVGDSQVLLVGNRGKVKLQTRSHSPVGYAVEAGVISEEEAIVHEDRHIVSNVVGTQDTHIEIGPRRKLSPRDTLLIASDGLFDNLHMEEIVELIRKGPLSAASRYLAQCVYRRMEGSDEEHPCKPDDLTFVMFRRSSSETI
jgi:serine/threonine protein phosphatase PrpC